MSPLIVAGICLSLVFHVLDQGTDIFAVVLFYFEGNLWASALTFGYVYNENIRSIMNIYNYHIKIQLLTLHSYFRFVMLPGFCIGLAELKRFCAKELSLFKSIGYILLSPLWVIVIHLYR